MPRRAPRVPFLSTVLLLLSLALALAPSAAAQVPGLTPTPTPTPTPSATPAPTPRPDSPPATPPPAPGPDYTTGEGDPAHRRWVTGADLAPPYAFAWRAKLPGTTGAVIAAGGRVFASYNAEEESSVSPGITGVAAFDAATGRPLWDVAAGPGSVPLLAYASGRVIISGGGSGRVRAVDAATGAAAWSIPAQSAVQVTGAGPDVVFESARTEQPSGNTAYFLSVADATSGAVRWSRKVSEGVSPSDPAVAGNRVYRGEGCRASAFDRRDGTPIWGRQYDCTESTGGAGVRLAGGLVVAGTRLLDAGDGHEVGRTPAKVDGLPDGVVFGPTGERAYGMSTLVDGRRIWTAPFEGAPGTDTSIYADGIASSLVPAVAIDDTLLLGDTRRLRLLDRGSGNLRWEGRILLGDDMAVGIGRPPIAGAGVILLPFERSLIALAPAARAPAPELSAKSVSPVVPFGRRFYVHGRLGTVLGQRSALSVEVDHFPFGRFRPLAATTTDGTGAFRLTPRPSRATRYRVGGAGLAERKILTAFVVPRFGVSVRRGAPDDNAVHERVRVRIPRAVRAAGRTLGVYVGRARAKRYDRLATGRLRGRRGSFATTVVFRAPRFGARDFVVFCVSGLLRQGIGVGDRLDRRCGARRVAY